VGVGGSGVANTVPLWSAGTTLGNSVIRQDANGVQLPNGVLLGVGAQGYQVSFGSPNGETGMSIAGPAGIGRTDLRFDGSTLKLVAGPAGGPPSAANGVAITTAGDVGVGTASPAAKLHVNGSIFANGVVTFLNGAQIYNGLNVYSGSLSVTSGVTVGGNLSVSDGIQVLNGLGVNSGNLGIASGSLTTNGMTSFGNVSFYTLGSVGQTSLCFNGGTLKTLATCSSSLRYKTDLHPFSGGMSIINRLRPVTFKWKMDNMLDVGFGAEDVADVEPLFVTHNDNGEIEGVKYERLSVVFVNAFKEQQTQIEKQQGQIEALQALVCLEHRDAEVCRKYYPATN
jgi:hypothetical protein